MFHPSSALTLGHSRCLGSYWEADALSDAASDRRRDGLFPVRIVSPDGLPPTPGQDAALLHLAAEPARVLSAVGRRS